jgi:hypothetical protein
MTSLFPPRQSLVSDIPAEDGNIEKLFLRCNNLSTPGKIRPDVPVEGSSLNAFLEADLLYKKARRKVLLGFAVSSF